MLPLPDSSSSLTNKRAKLSSSLLVGEEGGGGGSSHPAAEAELLQVDLSGDLQQRQLPSKEGGAAVSK